MGIENENVSDNVNNNSCFENVSPYLLPQITGNLRSGVSL